jgi:hypothetical protein
MPEAGVIQPAHLLALSLMALGVTTLHGARSSSPSVPGALRTLTAVGALSGASALPRDRLMRTCAPTRERAIESGAGCTQGR